MNAAWHKGVQSGETEGLPTRKMRHVLIYDTDQRCNVRLGALVDHHRRRANSLFLRAPIVGKGVYGEARALRDEAGTITCVAKLVPFHMKPPVFIGGRHCPMRPENCEGAIAELLRRYVVEPARSPHVARYDTLPYHFSRERRVHLMPYADLGSLSEYVREVPKAAIDSVVMVSLFQMAYTLAATQQVLPGFRHNDLNGGNVLVYSAADPEGYDEYHIGGEAFYVPRLGFTCHMTDFDYACVPGIVDNSKAIEEECNRPTHSMGAFPAPGFDFYLLVQNVLRAIHHLVPAAFRSRFDAVFGGKRRLVDAYLWNKDRLLRPLPADLCHLPSPFAVLLKTPLFDAFRELPPGDAVVYNTYAARPLQPNERHPAQLSLVELHCSDSPPALRVPLYRWSTVGTAQTAPLASFSAPRTRHYRWVAAAVPGRASASEQARQIRRLRHVLHKFVVFMAIPSTGGVRAALFRSAERAVRRFLKTRRVTAVAMYGVFVMAIMDAVREHCAELMLDDVLGPSGKPVSRECLLMDFKEWAETTRTLRSKQLLQIAVQWTWYRNEQLLQQQQPPIRKGADNSGVGAGQRQ